VIAVRGAAGLPVRVGLVHELVSARRSAQSSATLPEKSARLPRSINGRATGIRSTSIPWATFTRLPPWRHGMPSFAKRH